MCNLGWVFQSLHLSATYRTGTKELVFSVLSACRPGDFFESKFTSNCGVCLRLARKCLSCPVKILTVHKCFQSFIQAKQTPFKAEGNLDCNNSLKALHWKSHRADGNSFLMGRSFLQKSCCQGRFLKSTCSALGASSKRCSIYQCFLLLCTRKKNKGPSLYKHSELSPFTCYFPSKSGENSFHKILGLCFVVFQIPQGRE